MWSLTALLALGIIGGEPSPAGPDDAVVCLSADTLPICSGVLLGPHTVLTAGHCAWTLGKATPYFIALGPDCHAPTRRVAVVDMVTHPSFTAMGKPFDLALVRLKTAVTTIAPLPWSSAPVDPALPLRHVGYGTNQESAMSGWGLRRTVTHAVLRVDADFVWSGDATANTCMGDSGGPALQPAPSGERVVAVVSDGPDCHSASADARVDVADGWVTQTLAAWEAPTPAPPPGPGCASAPESSFALAALWLLGSRPKRKSSNG